MQRRIRVLVGKPGLDGHDRGAKVVAAALRDAGMEVIYTGLHQTPEQIVEAAVQEDVDVVALSVLSGAHMTLFPEIQSLMQQHGIGDKLLTGGGIIPGDDMKNLFERGVGRLFGPGSSTVDIVHYIREWYGEKFGADALPPLPPPPARPEPVAGSGDMPMPSAARMDRHHAAANKPARKSSKKSVKKAAPKKAANKAAAKPAKKKAAKKAAAKPAKQAAKKKTAKKATKKAAKKPAPRKAPAKKAVSKPAKRKK
jgi:methylmalonyl-CoA mutase C-terminal domain/subunit